MKIGVHINNYNPHGYYSKADGLINAAKKLGFDYSLYKKGHKYDVVINWEPFKEIYQGEKLTVVWTWDTHLTTMNPNINEEYDLIFRAHATFFFREGIDIRQKPTYWMPPAVDPEIFTRNPQIKPEYDLIFVGRGRGRALSKQVLETLEKYCDFKWISDKHPIDEYIDKYSLGRILVNIPEAGETNKRVFETMSMGPAAMPWGRDYSLLITPYRHYIPIPNFHLYEGEELDQVATEFSKEIRELIGHPHTLNKIASEGRQLVLEKFSFEQQVLRINKVLSFHVK